MKVELLQNVLFRTIKPDIVGLQLLMMMMMLLLMMMKMLLLMLLKILLMMLRMLLLMMMMMICWSGPEEGSVSLRGPHMLLLQGFL